MLPLITSILALIAVQAVVAEAPVHIDATGGVFYIDVANHYQVFHKDSSCYFWPLTAEEAKDVMTPQGIRAMETMNDMFARCPGINTMPSRDGKEEMTLAMHHGVHVTHLDITTIGNLASAILSKCQDLHNYAVTRPHGHHGGTP